MRGLPPGPRHASIVCLVSGPGGALSRWSLAARFAGLCVGLALGAATAAPALAGSPGAAGAGAGPLGLPGDVAQLQADHFKCYDARPPRTFRSRTVRLADQFLTETVSVRKPATLCNPVKKNQEGIWNPRGHLTCYPIAADAGFVARAVLVRNQFGTATLTVRGPETLCVPSSKTVLSGKSRKVGPGVPGAVTDHYKCYAAQGPGPSVIVKLADQFHLERVRVLEPVSFCNPVSKNGEPIAHPLDHLTCYAVKDVSRRRFADRVVRVRNQLGSHVLTVVKPRTLCVPSLKPAVEPPPEEPPCDGSLAYGGIASVSFGFICRIAGVSFLLLLPREIVGFEPPPGFTCRLLTTHVTNDSLVCEGSAPPGVGVWGTVETSPPPSDDMGGQLYLNTGPMTQEGPFPITGPSG